MCKQKLTDYSLQNSQISEQGNIEIYAYNEDPDKTAQMFRLI